MSCIGDRFLPVLYGAVVRAARALGARVGVEQALPRELLVLTDAPLLLVFEIELRQIHRAVRAVAREDVRQRAEQVDVLGVGQVVEERQQHEHVQPVADRRAALGVLRRKQLRELVRDRQPPRVVPLPAISYACRRSARA